MKEKDYVACDLQALKHCCCKGTKLWDYCCKTEYEIPMLMIQLFNPLATQTKFCMVTCSQRAPTFILEQNILKSQGNERPKMNKK